MIVKIDKLSHDFRGITKINDKVTFVSNVLPNEVVDIRITNSKKSINEAKVISYIEESNDRIKPICPYNDICGGCDISYINYDKSLKYKKEIVKDIIRLLVQCLITTILVSVCMENGWILSNHATDVSSDMFWTLYSSICVLVPIIMFHRGLEGRYLCVI